MTCIHDMFIHAGIQAQSPSLMVTSLPAVLFQTNGGVHNITAGSVIQLYCSVQSTTASFSWTKDGRPVVLDVPHLRERTCNDVANATSTLTVDNFQFSDDGAYRCTAMDGNTTGQGGSIEMRGIILLYTCTAMPTYNTCSINDAYTYNVTVYLHAAWYKLNY